MKLELLRVAVDGKGIGGCVVGVGPAVEVRVAVVINGALVG